jgi:hypothetical protein
MSSVNKIKIILLILVLLLATLAWFDIKDYQYAIESFDKVNSANDIIREGDKVSDDLKRIAKCKTLADTQNNDTNTNVRSCFMSLMVDTKTSTTTAKAVIAASKWLNNHPDDIEFKTAALSAVNQGREFLLKEKSRYYDKLEAIAVASNKSFILRTFSPEQNTSEVISKNNAIIMLSIDSSLNNAERLVTQ